MHKLEMVSSPGCSINTQGQRADPHGGNLIEESLLAILEKKKKENTPARSRLHKDTQAGSLAWSSPCCQALAGRHIPFTKLEDTASSSPTSSSDGTVSAPPRLKCP